MNYMSGTLSPEQLMQMERQQMMANALRGPQQQSTFNPAKRNQVQDAGYFGDGMNVGAIGGAMGNIGSNIGTAMQYGTTPFSQQTNMLAAQDAAFR